MHTPSPPSRLPRRVPRLTLLAVGGVLLYATLVWGDLLPAAGLRYAPLPAGAGEVAAHWWDKTQGLRGWSIHPEGWVWPYRDPAPWPRWLPLLGLLALGGWGLKGWGRSNGPPPAARSHRVSLLALVLLGYLIGVAVFWLRSADGNQLLMERIYNRSFTGYLTSANQTAHLSTFFVGYADALQITDLATKLCGHCRTHPPGPILAYWLPLQAVRALPTGVQTAISDGLRAALQIGPPAAAPGTPPPSPAEYIIAILGGHAILLGTALIVLPLYGLARRLAGARWALPLAALGLVAPGLALMNPEFDQIYATFVAVLLYLAVRGLGERRVGLWGLLVGGWLAWCLYWSLGLWVMAGVLAVLGVAARLGVLQPALPGVPAARPVPWAGVARWGAGVAAGTAVPWLLLWSVGRFDLPTVLATTSRLHLAVVTAARPYWPWLLFNLVDILQFIGLPLVAVTLATLYRRPSPTPVTLPSETPTPNPQSPTPNPQPPLRRVNFYGLLFWTLLLALDLSGTVRGEAGRIWLFLIPFALLGIYAAVGRGWLGGRALFGLLAAQTLVLLVIGGRWFVP